MRLRTFTAPDMPAAMRMVRDALGDNAIILSADTHAGKKNITVTAAVDISDDEDFDVKPAKITAPPVDTASLDDLRFDLQNLLRFHNIPELFIAKMMQKAGNKELFSLINSEKTGKSWEKTRLLSHALEKILESYFQFDPLLFGKQSHRLMLVGPPGIGKTLTIAKIAAKLSMDKNKPVVITTDNKRAGGVEQLQAFTTILGLELQVASNLTELKKHIGSVSASTQLLIDTAGCNPYEHHELLEIKEFSGIKSIEPVLVLPAGGDSLESIDIVESFAELPIKRLLITRADTARRFGGILAAAAAHSLAFCNVSSSSSIIDPLQALSSGALAQLLQKYRIDKL